MFEKERHFKREEAMFLLAVQALKSARAHGLEISGYHAFTVAEEEWPMSVHLQRASPDTRRSPEEYRRKMGAYVELVLELDEQSKVDQQG